MTFTSYTFAVFAAILLCAYYLVPGRWQWKLLLLSSYVFYIWAGTEYLAFILITTVSTYITAILMGKNFHRQDVYLAEHKADMTRDAKKTYKARIKSMNRYILIICLTVNFGMLFLCKALLVEPLKSLAKESSVSFLTLGLPLGISFYMFQSMGYVIDVYRGTIKAEHNFARLALFVSFFPQLVQGPISKYSQLAPTLFSPHKFDSKRVAFGLQRMLWGYFKKLVVADRIAAAVVALKGDAYIGTAFVVLALFYAIQIYSDFTGGIDVTIGLAEALGITVPENFVRPFFSKNIAEYWRRWHISLGVWMKDYIFYPISVSEPMRKLSKWGRAKMGNFGKRLPVYVASIVTWFATGIWHGFSPNFVVWGMLNCLVIVVSEELAPLYEKFHSRFGWKEKSWYGCFEVLRTFCLMNLIRACDLFANIGVYFQRLGSVFTTCNLHILWDGTILELGLDGLDYGILCVSLLLMFGVSMYQEIIGSVREKLWQNPFRSWALFFILFIVILLLGNYGIGYDATNFIYNQF